MVSRAVDVVALVLVLLGITCTAFAVDLASVLKSRRNGFGEKRNNILDASHFSLPNGNPCKEPEKPFPCKETSMCIPMGYVCDDNYDCEDGYDEDPLVCTAFHRPPVEDIIHFLEREKDWLLPLFGDNFRIGKIAHGLAVSGTFDDFIKRVGLKEGGIDNLKTILQAVYDRDEMMMESLGMPGSSWGEVSFFFTKLLKSGFYPN